MPQRFTTRTATTIIAALLAALFTASCSTGATSATTDSAESWLAEYELDGLEGREIIEHLDATPVADRPEDLIASVEPDSLVLFDGERKVSSIPLPEDEFYLSLAPYLQQAHDCHFHSLTTCLTTQQLT
ncbi:MAG TPA: CueP family metal-binding protein [Jiangellaceae bacterium]|nr:CueP family metal-binding protein [Jiangellaceae bacterium]